MQLDPDDCCRRSCQLSSKAISIVKPCDKFLYKDKRGELTIIAAQLGGCKEMDPGKDGIPQMTAALDDVKMLQPVSI